MFSRVRLPQTKDGSFLRTARAHLSGICAGVQPGVLEENKRPFVFEDGTCSLEREMRQCLAGCAEGKQMAVCF